MSNALFLYGQEFWHYLESRLVVAKHHVIVFTGFTNERELGDLFSKIQYLPHLVLIRNDNKIDLSKFINCNLLMINSSEFHAKMIIIDDIIIIGSQNLYKVSSIPLEQKAGEISIALRNNNIISIVYQALMIVLKNEYSNYFELLKNQIREDIEFPSEENILFYLFHKQGFNSFLNIRSRMCPCCGMTLSFEEQPENIIACEQYNECVRQSECGSYNACKYCIEKHISTPEQKYYCSCGFEAWYQTEELQKYPYYTWLTMINIIAPVPMIDCLKLYLYLADRIGEQRTNFLLSSLGIVGNLKRLSLEQRIFDFPSI